MLRINARTFIKFLSPQLEVKTKIINYKLFCGIFTKKYYLHIDTRSFIFLIYYFIGVVYINVFIETLGQAFFKYFCIYRGRLKEGGGEAYIQCIAVLKKTNKLSKNVNFSPKHVFSLNIFLFSNSERGKAVGGHSKSTFVVVEGGGGRTEQKR